MYISQFTETGCDKTWLHTHNCKLNLQNGVLYTHPILWLWRGITSFISELLGQDFQSCKCNDRTDQKQAELHSLKFEKLDACIWPLFANSVTNVYEYSVSCIVSWLSCIQFCHKAILKLFFRGEFPIALVLTRRQVSMRNFHCSSVKSIPCQRVCWKQQLLCQIQSHVLVRWQLLKIRNCLQHLLQCHGMYEQITPIVHQPLSSCKYYIIPQECLTKWMIKALGTYIR